ncbi:MAG: hypothetical protein QOG17_338 [Gammaproteobacteria bacterium]|nr:hypothetical protein [Gammaproteobacteria bacterium]
MSHVRQIGRSVGKSDFDLGLLPLQLSHPAFHGRLVHTILDGAHDPFNAPLDILKGAAARFCICPPFMALAIALLRIGSRRDRHGLRRMTRHRLL